MKNHRKARVRAKIAVAVLLYLILGSVIPYMHQPKVSSEYAKNLEVESFYSDTVSADRAMIIKENGPALQERLELISSAKERILLSTFAFKADEAGKDVLAALLDAAERDVEIKILADGFNSWLYMEFNPYFYALSAKPNVEIKIYNKVNPFTPWKAMGRMHDKYVLADDTAYILGGRNTFGYFLGDYEGYKNHDWDVLIYNAKGKGSTSSLYQIEEYFNAMWKKETCSLFHNSEKLSKKGRVVKAAQELRERYERLLENNHNLAQNHNYEEKTYPANKVTLISNPTDIYPKEPIVFYTLAEIMKNAKKNVYIHTPYMICNNMMYNSFADIAENVPQFNLLTNSAVNNGNLFAAGDYLRNKEKLLNTGMSILEYEGGTSYHGKCIAVDDDMSLIGSFNMDMRSVYLNTELMLAINGKELNASLREQMESYEDKSLRVINVDTYEDNPSVQKQKMPKIKENLLEIVSFLTGWARFLL